MWSGAGCVGGRGFTVTPSSLITHLRSRQVCVTASLLKPVMETTVSIDIELYERPIKLKALSRTFSEIELQHPLLGSI